MVTSASGAALPTQAHTLAIAFVLVTGGDSSPVGTTEFSDVQDVSGSDPANIGAKARRPRSSVSSLLVRSLSCDDAIPSPLPIGHVLRRPPTRRLRYGHPELVHTLERPRLRRRLAFEYALPTWPPNDVAEYDVGDLMQGDLEAVPSCDFPAKVDRSMARRPLRRPRATRGGVPAASRAVRGAWCIDPLGPRLPSFLAIDGGNAPSVAAAPDDVVGIQLGLKEVAVATTHLRVSLPRTELMALRPVCFRTPRE